MHSKALTETETHPRIYQKHRVKGNVISNQATWCVLAAEVLHNFLRGNLSVSGWV